MGNHPNNINTNQDGLAGFLKPTILLLLLMLITLGGITLGKHLYTRNQASTWGPVLELTSFTESGVSVAIRLEKKQDGGILLTAEFIPVEEGFHLYSKDLPLQGIDGLGRPTRLDLTSQSKMKPKGVLQESVSPIMEILAKGEPALPIYPAGEVELRLLVEIPPCDDQQLQDQVSVSYMACSRRGCRKPVMGKIVSVIVPCIAVE